MATVVVNTTAKEKLIGQILKESEVLPSVKLVQTIFNEVIQLSEQSSKQIVSDCVKQKIWNELSPGPIQTIEKALIEKLAKFLQDLGVDEANAEELIDGQATLKKYAAEIDNGKSNVAPVPSEAQMKANRKYFMVLLNVSTQIEGIMQSIKPIVSAPLNAFGKRIITALGQNGINISVQTV